MSDPMSDDRLAEIAGVQLGDWYGGEWTTDYVEGDGEEPAYWRVIHHESGSVLATLPDYAGPIALWIADAHEAVPELLAQVARLTPELQVGVTAVRVTETARSGWQVRYRLNGKRKSQRHFPSKDRADAWIEQQRERHGGTK
jgi:hypothetical protein